jgi:hypothetical protein
MTETFPKLGPDGFTSIAIIGSAPSSTLLAPFKDPAWSIWACSPGSFAAIASQRADVWFELHRWLPYQPGQIGAPGTRQWFSPEFTAFLQQFAGPVFMTSPYAGRDPLPFEQLCNKYGRPQESIPNSVPFPYGYLIEKHGLFHWTSQITLMLALAIETLAPRAAAGEKVSIGLFGVDMSAAEEYGYQRPGCQHFLGMAKALGINIVLPPESDLMQPTTIYGLGEHTHRHVKLRERLMELEQAKAQLTQGIQHSSMQLKVVEGQLLAYNNMLTVWSDDLDPDLAGAISYGGSYTKPLGSLNPASMGAAVLELDRPYVEAGKH